MKILNLRHLAPALLLLTCLAIASPLAQASYVNLGPAGDFNIFVFGDNTQYNSDVEGRLAVGGNIDFTLYGSGFTVASLGATNTDNLIVGGNYKNFYNTARGGVLVNGDVDWVGPTITGRLNVNGNANFHNAGGQIAGPVNVVGTYTAPFYFPANANPPNVTPLPFDFGEVQSYLTSLSSYMAGLTPNGTTETFFNQLHLTAAGPADQVYVFNVTGSQMANAAGSGLFITAPAGSTVVVNVDGSATSMQNMGISLNGVDRQHVLYNFFEADSLGISSISIEGTILAPLADVNFMNGQINGTLIANNLTGNGESHLHLFQGTLPLVPEPSTLLLAGIGALTGAVYRFRRRSC